MNADFHYYATYCAAVLAGFSHEESTTIAYADNFVDVCSRSLLSHIGGPGEAATTQLSLEMMDARTDIIGLQDITRIWASFHFLPKDLYAKPDKHCSKKYLNKYRLICGPDSELVEQTVEIAKDETLQAIGLAMHVISDTWAHQNFAGTPSMVINDVMEDYIFEMEEDGDGYRDIKPAFRHSASAPDDLDKHLYTRSIGTGSEKNIMNLGHGRMGHFPDLSFLKYRYVPAWGNYEEIIKDNPSDFKKAFCQMITALKYLRGDKESFKRGEYDCEAIADIDDEIEAILRKRQADAGADWCALGEKLSGVKPESFDESKYLDEYMEASKEDKDGTFLGKFIVAALKHKSMVTAQIFRSGNKLAGRSVDSSKRRIGGMKVYKKIARKERGA